MLRSIKHLLRSLLRFLRYPLCRHTETLTKTAGTRAYTECLRCEYQSKGVEIAGHDYASTKHSWEPAPRVPLMTAAEVSAKLDAMPHVAIATEPVYTSIDWAPNRTEFSIVTTPVLGNLAGHATRPHSKSPLCKSCGEPKEATRPNSNNCRACDRAKATRLPRKTTPYPAKRKQRKISAIKPRKTSRKPSSKRSKTA